MFLYRLSISFLLLLCLSLPCLAADNLVDALTEDGISETPLKVIGPIVAAPVGLPVGAARGAKQRIVERVENAYYSDMNPLSKVFGIVMGSAIGLIFGAAKGGLNGLTYSFTEGMEKPFSKESFSLNEDWSLI